MILIREGEIEEVVALSRAVPEFVQVYEEEAYIRRLSQRTHLILIAEVDGAPAGFKVCYQSETPGIVYSWMGAVLPAYRKSGLAAAMADRQQDWARRQGFHTIRFKTRNRFIQMLHFGLSNGFRIVGFEKKGEVADYRILLEKQL
jgi:predicted GNAT superfamily acetyltransferase